MHLQMYLFDIPLLYLNVGVVVEGALHPAGSPDWGSSQGRSFSVRLMGAPWESAILDVIVFKVFIVGSL